MSMRAWRLFRYRQNFKAWKKWLPYVWKDFWRRLRDVAASALRVVSLVLAAICVINSAGRLSRSTCWWGAEEAMLVPLVRVDWRRGKLIAERAVDVERISGEGSACGGGGVV
jgi:hypothetical protein